LAGRAAAGVRDDFDDPVLAGGRDAVVLREPAAVVDVRVAIVAAPAAVAFFLAGAAPEAALWGAADGRLLADFTGGLVTADAAFR
jgi:hypothetical protein